MNKPNLFWQVKPFDSLTAREICNILALRQEVFIVEQNCPYVDIDGKDNNCHHLMGLYQDKLCAYLRIVPPGLIFDELSLGRIVTAGSIRGQGVGRLLMHEGLQQAFAIFGQQPIRIAAQQYLLDFYRSFEFRVVSEPYDEDGIPHVLMLREN